MELLKPHDPGEDRTRRCHHHRPRSCCPTGPPTHPGQQRSPTVSITVCWWPSPRCPTRVCAVLAGACTFAAITDWVRDLDRPAWGRLGFTDRVPAATTVWRLLIRIDAGVRAAVAAGDRHRWEGRTRRPASRRTPGPPAVGLRHCRRGRAGTDADRGE